MMVNRHDSYRVLTFILCFANVIDYVVVDQWYLLWFQKSAHVFELFISIGVTSALLRITNTDESLFNELSLESLISFIVFKRVVKNFSSNFFHVLFKAFGYE